MRTLMLGIAASFIASTALADIQVRFDEGAPKDRFTVTQTGACNLGAAEITIDLSGSSHGLIFDVTSRGQGVEVFQPFELVTGAAYLTSTPVVQDGDQSIALPVKALLDGQSVAFTIDVDDTAGGREITVSDAEIAGASVSVKTASGDYVGTFDNRSKAMVEIDNCTS